MNFLWGVAKSNCTELRRILFHIQGEAVHIAYSPLDPTLKTGQGTSKMV
jgi:hypothetical protein